MCNNKFEAYKNYGSYQFSWLRTGNFQFAGKGGGKVICNPGVWEKSRQ